MTDPAELAKQAERILQDRKFSPRRTPAPFRGLLRWLGEKLEPVTDLLGRITEPVFNLVARLWDEPLGQLLLVVLFVLVVGALAQGIARRRGVSAIERGPSGQRRISDDPDALDREAAAAEQRGDLDAVVRLRFRAGLARLERAGRLAPVERRTTHAIARELDEPSFDLIGRTFDSVAYGRRPATSADVAASDRAWDEVLAGKPS